MKVLKERDEPRRRPDLPPAFQQTVANGQLFEQLPIGIYCCDRDGLLLQFNERAAELWGRMPSLGMSDERFCGSHKLFALDGTPMPHDATPMAAVLRTGSPARDQTVVIERPDGSRAVVLVNIEPVFEDDGELAGAVNCFQDITAIERAREAIAAKERHLQAVLEALPAAIYTTDAEGRVTFYNEAAVAFAGRRPELGRDEWCVSFRLYRPDGDPLPHEECPMAQAIRQRRPIRGAEAVAERPDGTRIPFLAFPTPLFDEDGRLAGAINMLVDITERKDAEEHQRLLMRELNHRVRNTLAMVQAIARQTLRRSSDPADFVASFSGRVQAMARAHALITASTWRGADVLELVREQLLLGGSDEGRIDCSGPSLMLAPQPALHLALALHELGTNARKYGALSVPEGRLSVSWTVRSSCGRDLLLQWQERGGPRVSAPDARGFGMTLIENSMHAHGGEVCISYAAGGVTCEIRLPLPEPDRTGVAVTDPLASPPSASRPSEDPAIAGKRILVIEDEPLVAVDVAASLEAKGCKIVGPAPTVAAARELIEREEFDAAIVDANLAGEPVHQIAAALTRRQMPFVFLSGYPREELPRAFASVSLVVKPFTDQALCDAIEQLFQARGKVARLRQGVG